MSILNLEHSEVGVTIRSSSMLLVIDGVDADFRFVKRFFYVSELILSSEITFFGERARAPPVVQIQKMIAPSIFCVNTIFCPNKLLCCIRVSFWR